MEAAPSILVLDQGELESFETVLEQLGLDFVRSSDRKATALPRPRRILVTTWRRALELPALEPLPDTEAPIWIVVHNQDFLPLRARLRTMGAHYLVHSSVDQRTLRLLFQELLFGGDEKRDEERLPVGVSTRFRMGLREGTAILAELSAGGARLISAEPLPDDGPISLAFPENLDALGRRELVGQVVRSVPLAVPGEEPQFTVSIRFGELDPTTVAHLQRVLEGELLGTRVTPLDRGARRNQSEREGQTHRIERRRSERRDYSGEVKALGALHSDQPVVVRGRDLSLQGIRIAPHPKIHVGDRLALALYGGPRRIIVEAQVVRDAGEDGLGLEFVGVTREVRQALERLIDELPPLISLGDGSPDDTLVFAQLMTPGGKPTD